MIVQKPGFLPKDALQSADFVKNPVSSSHIMSGRATAIFVGASLTNNTCQQSPISKTRPDRDIIVERSDMISKCDRELFNKKTSYQNPQLL